MNRFVPLPDHSASRCSDTMPVVRSCLQSSAAPTDITDCRVLRWLASINAREGRQDGLDRSQEPFSVYGCGPPQPIKPSGTPEGFIGFWRRAWPAAFRFLKARRRRGRPTDGRNKPSGRSPGQILPTLPNKKTPPTYRVSGAFCCPLPAARSRSAAWGNVSAHPETALVCGFLQVAVFRRYDEL